MIGLESPANLAASSSGSSAGLLFCGGSCGMRNRRKNGGNLGKRSFLFSLKSGNLGRISFAVRAGDSSSLVSEPNEEENAARNATDVQTVLKRFWKVAAPYWYSDDKIQARLRLAAVFALTLGTTGISVGFNFLGRDFYNALANKDQDQFTKQLIYYLAGFAGGIPVFVLRDYAKDTLSLRWRSWMTSFYMDRYLNNRTFYIIQSQSIIDNPDQRIVDDLSAFTGTALAFSLTFFNAAVDLISFSNILYGIYPPLFLVLLGYSFGGTAISVFLGRGLASLNFLQEKKEADFRYGLVRIRENAESIAFYGGEENETQLLLQRFRSAFENLSKLLISSRNLEFFTSGYRYLIQILPAAVVAPMYFSGKIEFGVINQSVSAFNHVLGDFSLIVYQFQAISAFSAVIDRLGEFDDLLDASESTIDSKTATGISRETVNFRDPVTSSNGVAPVSRSSKLLLSIDRFTLLTPSNTPLIRDLTIEVSEKEHLLISGPSGSGKTSLLRALAGLWSYGNGSITFFDDNLQSVKEEEEGRIRGRRRRRRRSVFFLPQRPYMVLGTLRQQLLYPTWYENCSETDQLEGTIDSSRIDDERRRRTKPTTEELKRILEKVRLDYVLTRFDLDSTHEWSSVLSIGEQQRLAFARLLLSGAELALLDESTSALDEPNEAHLYRLMEESGITYVSIGHRKSLYRHHVNVLNVSPSSESWSPVRNWSLEPIINKSPSPIT